MLTSFPENCKLCTRGGVCPEPELGCSFKTEKGMHRSVIAKVKPKCQSHCDGLNERSHRLKNLNT